MDATMPTRYLDWPFFERRATARSRAELDAWARPQHVRARRTAPTSTPTAARWCARSATAGWLRHAVGGSAYGGAGDAIDTRAICLIRETLARHSGLADFAFAMQGLGSGAISLAGTPRRSERYLPRVARGEAIAAFALSEPEAGSDVAAMQLRRARRRRRTACSTARRPGSPTAASPISTSCSRAPAKRPARAASRAFIVDADTPGFEIAERIDVIAPHPLARLRFTDCRVPLTQRIGAAGEGFKVAMRTLDVFRTSVAAAALGFARRALDEALQRATHAHDVRPDAWPTSS